MRTPLGVAWSRQRLRGENQRLEGAVTELRALSSRARTAARLQTSSSGARECHWRRAARQGSDDRKGIGGLSCVAPFTCFEGLVVAGVDAKRGRHHANADVKLPGL